MKLQTKLVLLPVVPLLAAFAIAAPAKASQVQSHGPLVPGFARHAPAPATYRTPAVGAETDTYVSTTGTDTGTCPQITPCATITYAESQTASGGTIHVAAGTYNQSADLTQPLTLEGAGESNTTIDGSNIDYTSSGYYGVIGIANATDSAGIIAVNGLTVTNAYITAAESNDDQEPVDIANYDQQVGDDVEITDVAFGPAQDETDFPGIGSYSLNAQSTNTVDSDTATGLYTAYFAEGSGGKTTFAKDKATELTGYTYQSFYYPAAGVFALSDTSGSLFVAANHDNFSGYNGWGVAAEAGYSSGNCSGGVCTGGLVINTNHDVFNLAAAPSYSGVAAISAFAQSHDVLTGHFNYSSGTVASPDRTVYVVNRGGRVHVSDSMNTIAVTH